MAGAAPLLLALCLSSALSVTLWCVRVVYSETTVFLFLNWNLLLAWIPPACAAGAWLVAGKRPTLAPLALLGAWLLFLPNAPYILTDLLHLAQRQNVPLWYDLFMLLSFAWNGLILGFTSLRIVQGLVEGWAGRAAAWGVVLLSLGASAFGVYLGRFLRWNSWDVLTEPGALAQDIFARVLSPLSYPRTLVVTALLAAFLILAYVTVLSLGRTPWRDGADKWGHGQM